MTTLIERMREELVRRHYAESTIRSYLHTIEDFRRYTHKRLDHLGPDDIRRYQVYLLEERQLNIGTASNYAAAPFLLCQDVEASGPEGGDALPARSQAKTPPAGYSQPEPEIACRGGKATG